MPQDDQNDEEQNQSRRRVTLNAPWGGLQRAMTAFQPANVAEGYDDKTIQHFVNERSKVHREYIEQNNKNKRLGMILAFCLILLTTLILVFAPEGRETISYWIGAALIIFSAGALGYGRVWGKAGSISFGADQDRNSL